MRSINQYVRKKYAMKIDDIITIITPEKFKQILSLTVAKLYRLTATKGDEYKQGSEDQLANFKRNAAGAEVHPLQIWRIYFMKHLDSILGWIKDSVDGKEQSYSEPIIERIDDAILYLILLKGFYYERHLDELRAIEHNDTRPLEEGGVVELYLGKQPATPFGQPPRNFRPERDAPEIHSLLHNKSRDFVFHAIAKEREFQDGKYGPVLDRSDIGLSIETQGPGGHELGAWIIIIEKELEEAKLAVIHGGSKRAAGRDSIRSELVQVAAVCVAALEQHGLVEEPDA